MIRFGRIHNGRWFLQASIPGKPSRSWTLLAGWQGDCAQQSLTRNDKLRLENMEKGDDAMLRSFNMNWLCWRDLPTFELSFTFCRHLLDNLYLDSVSTSILTPLSNWVNLAAGELQEQSGFPAWSIKDSVMERRRFAPWLMALPSPLSVISRARQLLCVCAMEGLVYLLFVRAYMRVCVSVLFLKAPHCAH